MIDNDTVWWLRNAALSPCDLLGDGKLGVFVRAPILHELLDEIIEGRKSGR